MRLVVKYGGSSIAGAGQVGAVARYVAGLAAGNEVAVVCSAPGGTTDELLRIADLAGGGDRGAASDAASGIAASCAGLAGAAAEGDAREELLARIRSDSAELAALVDGMALLGEVTPRSRDHLLSFGERLSAAVLSAAISGAGAPSVPLTGKEAGIMTDSNFGASRPLMDTTRRRVSKEVGSLVSGGTVPVVGGFAGADQHGRVTTFGRGGSDYTAAIVGSCIGADEIWLMSDVAGLMTADPRVVPGASLIGRVTYAEAVEMALFGAKQIHPRTFEPVLEAGIPMRIRSSTDTENPGTLVHGGEPEGAGDAAKCVSSIRGCGLVDIRGGSMVGTPGTAGRIFERLARAGVNVMMISQNPSESSITIVVRNSDLDGAVRALEGGLHEPGIRKLDVTTEVAIIALIGAGMRGAVGVASRAFGAVERRGINVMMITQGSSELNLAFVVRNGDADGAVQALHEAFGLGA
ncbi:MAG: aspartate kinase [Nitrosopumilus sp.]|nr:aspartate kinase [Nitrosopumilus sp.]CAI9830866.1 putative aspartokinase [Nitrosopumilaceae archaeon]MDA7941121.1 aspartate kinase [Nitrosopumilus sp.]MDA7942481.1 aspartate kinase [Nitrosopumilus sp.]MDA7944560.1 aspartate kinase [Nitrosopumilus sp.]